MDEAATRPHLGEVRTTELEHGSGILGVVRGDMLGYRDSGMVGTADNENPSSFHQAPVAEAAAKLAMILRQEKPEVVVTYAEDGIYGHPDHVKAHFVTVAALDSLLRSSEPWTPKKLYYMAIPRSLMQAFREQMPEEARRDDTIGATIQGTPDEPLTTKVYVNELVDRKRTAFAAHV